MTDFILRVEGLTKRYGRVEAVRDVSFSLRRNAITAFLGENGAGKTTTLKAILGFLKMDGGLVEIGAERVGYVPEHPVFFPWLKGWDILRLTARLFGVSGGAGHLGRRVEEMCDRLRFESLLLERKVQTYSLGNQKKFSYLQSLIICPDLLIVDEPFSSLDPLSIKGMRDLWGSLRGAGQTIFLSSHLISEIEKVCDDVIIIRRGKILLEESVEELRRAGTLDLERLFIYLHSQDQPKSDPQK